MTSAHMPTVLVVDDDPMQRSTLRLGLEPRGFRIIEADNGRSALKAVAANRPDLVLLDLRMPVLDGLGFLAELDVAALDLPVMVVSGVEDVALAAKAFKLGAMDFVRKPVRNIDLIEQTLKNALRRRDLARQARQADQRYHTLVQNVPMTVFLLGKNNTFTFVSNHLKTMLGYLPSSVLNRPGWLVDHTHPDDRERLKKLLEGTLNRQDKPRSADCRLEKSGGEHAYCLLKVIPLGLSEDGSPQAEGVILDISDRVALERFLVQREKLKTLGSIAAGLAHEIRNPLMSIGGFARRMQEKYPQAAEAAIILEEAKRLEDMLQRTMTYLSPVKIKTETCSLNQTAREVLAVLACEYEVRGIEAKLTPGPTDPRVQEDPELLAQVVINLVRQLLKHLPDGATVELTTSEAGKFALLTAAGSPVQEVNFDEAFSLPFDQAGAQSGLPFARRMLGLMGGVLAVENQGGRAVVTVTLPKKRERL